MFPLIKRAVVLLAQQRRRRSARRTVLPIAAALLLLAVAPAVVAQTVTTTTFNPPAGATFNLQEGLDGSATPIAVGIIQIVLRRSPSTTDFVDEQCRLDTSYPDTAFFTISPGEDILKTSSVVDGVNTVTTSYNCTLSYIGTGANLGDILTTSVLAESSTSILGAEYIVAVVGPPSTTTTFNPPAGATFTLMEELDGSTTPIVVGTIQIVLRTSPSTIGPVNERCYLGTSNPDTAFFTINRGEVLKTSSVVDGEGTVTTSYNCTLSYIGTGANAEDILTPNVVAESSNSLSDAGYIVNVRGTLTFDDANPQFSFAYSDLGDDGTVVVGTVRVATMTESDDALTYTVDNPLYRITSVGVLSYIGAGAGASDTPHRLNISAAHPSYDSAATLAEVRFPHYLLFAATQSYTFDLPEGVGASSTAPILLGSIAPVDTSENEASCAFVNGQTVDQRPRDSSGRFEIENRNGECILYYIGAALATGAGDIVVPVSAAYSNRSINAAFTIRVLDPPSNNYTFELNQYDNVNLHTIIGSSGSGSGGQITTASGPITLYLDPPEPITEVINASSYEIVSTNNSERFSIDTAGTLFYIGVFGEAQDTRVLLRTREGQNTAFTNLYIDVQGMEFVPQQTYNFTLGANISGQGQAILLGTIVATDGLGLTGPRRNFYRFLDGLSFAPDEDVFFDSYDSPQQNFALHNHDPNDPAHIGHQNGVGYLYYIGTGTNQTTALAITALSYFNPLRQTSVIFTVEVATVNFDPLIYVFTLSRGFDASVEPLLLGRLPASDELGETVTYGILDAGVDHLFSINASSGDLYYISGVPGAGPYTEHDFLTIYGVVGSPSIIGGQRAGFAYVFFTVENDQAPEFTEEIYAFDLQARASGTPDAIVMGTIAATDGNHDVPLRYSIVSGNEGESFTIDAANGVLSYIGSGETLSASLYDYRLEVRVDDGLVNLAATTDVQITNIGVSIDLVSLQFVNPGEIYNFSLDQGYDAGSNPIILGTINVTDVNGDSFAFTVPAAQNVDQVSTGGPNSFLFDTAGVLRYHGSGAFGEASCGCIVLRALVQTNAPLPVAEKVKRSLPIDVTVYLLNQDAPQFTTGDNYQFSLVANTVGPIVLGTINATDPNQESVAYLLDPSDTPFSIGETSGIISYASADAAVAGVHDLFVVAEDGVGNARQAPVTITVRGLHSSQSGYTFSLNQGVSGGSDPVGPLGTIIIIDPEPQQTIIFSLQETDRVRFSISENPIESVPTTRVNAVVWYIGGGEFENSVVSIVVNSTQFLTVDVAIAVQNTLLPEFDPDTYTFRIDAGSDGSTAPLVFGSVRATDPNGDEVMYALTSNNMRFSIGATDGSISYIGSGEIVNTFAELTISASDGFPGHPAVNATFIVEFIGLQFDAPYTFALTKGAPGTRVLGTVVANDPTGSSSAISYGVSDSANFAIASSATQGVVSYIGSGESTDQLLTLTATAADGRIATTAIVIEIDNDAVPAFLADAYTFYLYAGESGTSAALAIGTVTATDANRERVYYRISCFASGPFDAQIDCGGGRRFAIGEPAPDSSGVYHGVLYYTGAGEAANAPPAAVFIRAHDSDSAAAIAVHEDFVSVSVEVASLQFLTPLTTFTLSRGLAGNGPAGAVLLGTFTATSPSGSGLQYTIDDTARFSIGVGDGVFSYIGSGETDDNTDIAVTVTATSDDDARAIALGVIVAVENDNVPVFQGAPYTFDLDADYSGTPNALPVGSVYASDANNDTVTYAFFPISGSDTHERFSIHATQGIVSYTGSGEALNTELTLRIEASDGYHKPIVAVKIRVGRRTIERNTKMTQHSLAQVGHNIAADTVDVLGTRFVSAPHVVFSGYALDSPQWHRLSRWTQLAHWRQTGAWDGNERKVALDAELSEKWNQFRARWVSGTSFLIPLSVRRGAVVDSQLALWGQGRISGYTREQQGIKASGTVLSGYLGVDYTLPDALLADDRLLLGLAFSQSRNDGYSRMSDGSQRIAIDMTINTIYPYLQWRSEDGFEAWGMFGYGSGSAKLNTAAEQDPNPVTDISMLSLAGGVRQALRTIGNHTVNSAELALKADVFMVRAESDATSGLDASQSDSHRFRLALADQRRWPFSNAAYSGGFELGARLDGGDTADGYGMDLGANIGYANTAIGLSLHSQGRWLLLHSEHRSEWGVDVTLRLRPRFKSRRLALLLKPGWGQRSTTDTQRLWEHGAASLDSNAGGSSARRLIPDHMRLSLSYGLQYHRALLQPFLEMDTAHDAVSDMKLGLKLSTANLQFTVSGDQLRRYIGIDGIFSW